MQTVKPRRNLNAANPLAVFPNGFDGGQVARIKNVLRRASQITFFQIVPRVACVYGDELQHAGVAVTINHAACAAVADEFGIVPLPDLAHGFLPKMAAVQIEVPIEVKIFVAAETAEFFLFAAQMPLHFVERFGGIHHGEAAARLHGFDVVEQLDEFVFGIIHEPAVAETQIAAGQRRKRITERAALEPKRFEERRQFFVIINQPAGGDAGGGLDAGGMEKFVGALDFFADVGQTTVLFVLRDVMRVDGHDDAGEAVAGELAHVLVCPEAAVGANHRANAVFRGIARHGAQIAMDHGFAAHEEEVADVIFQGDVDGQLGFVEGDATARLGIEFGARETAEIAIGVANVRDGKLEVAGTAVIQNFAQQLELSLFRPCYRLGEISRGGRRKCLGRHLNCLRITHSKGTLCPRKQSRQ